MPDEPFTAPPGFAPIPSDEYEVSANGGPWVRVPPGGAFVIGGEPVVAPRRAPEARADAPHVVTPAN